MTASARDDGGSGDSRDEGRDVGRDDDRVDDGDSDPRRVALVDRVAALEAELEEFRTLAVLHEEADAQLERAVRDHLALADAIAPLLPMLARHTGAVAVWLRSVDEDLVARDFAWPAAGLEWPHEGLDALAQRLVDAADGYYVRQETGGCTLLGQRLDVAGEDVGVVAVLVDAALDTEAQLCVARRLDTWCEALDGFLASLALSRRKHRIVAEISRALRDPVLDVGLSEAIAVLERAIGFRDLVVAFRHEDDTDGATLHTRIVREGRVVHDSSAPVEPRDAGLEALVAREGLALVLGEPTGLLEALGIEQPRREEVLVSGVRRRRIIGRVVATSRHGAFSAFERDLLERFADYVQLRVIDFNRVWTSLSRSFGPPAVRRLLADEDYQARHLAPREAPLAILFADIAGFTSLCERLQVPSVVGRLIDAWSAEVMRTIFATGGVFDKMIGDCVIGLWGPPFFELDAAALCGQALEAATRIREQTRALGRSGAFPELAGESLEVAIGLNYTRAVVGHFGPEADYTCFGSGMNNTARLQGVARAGEVLCAEAFCSALGAPQRFGELLEARVKNVSQPLRYAALR